MDINTIENNSAKIDEMVQLILGDSLSEIDKYMAKVRTAFIDNDEILTQDLDKIVLQIPVYLFDLIVIAQKIEMKKGVAKEQAAYAKNEALLNQTGTVVEKTAKAENQTVQERLTQTAYNTAASIVAKKIDGAMAILDSAKKVQARRMAELKLTSAVGSAGMTF